MSQPMGIEIRGSTSARDFSKKSFAMETRNREGKDERISLLGESLETTSRTLPPVSAHGRIDKLDRSSLFHCCKNILLCLVLIVVKSTGVFEYLS